MRHLNKAMLLEESLVQREGNFSMMAVRDVGRGVILEKLGFKNTVISVRLLITVRSPC